MPSSLSRQGSRRNRKTNMFGFRKILCSRCKTPTRNYRNGPAWNYCCYCLKTNGLAVSCQLIRNPP